MKPTNEAPLQLAGYTSREAYPCCQGIPAIRAFSFFSFTNVYSFIYLKMKSFQENSFHLVID